MMAGETVVIVGSGPSLDDRDLDLARSAGARMIVLNDNYQRAPWADVLYFCDATWFQWHQDAADFAGLVVTLENLELVGKHGFKSLHNGGLGDEPTADPKFLCDIPWRLYHGNSSGYQAIGLAAHFGVRSIILTGFDCKRDAAGRSHWFGEHPVPGAINALEFIRIKYPNLVRPLADRGIGIINATRDTALECFERRTMGEALVL